MHKLHVLLIQIGGPTSLEALCRCTLCTCIQYAPGGDLPSAMSTLYGGGGAGLPECSVEAAVPGLEL
jgi:hypothetical protein